MKKKLYEKPSAEVVKLQQKEALLQPSTSKSVNANATMNTTWTEEDI